MTNSLEQLKAIVDGAPSSATHFIQYQGSVAYFFQDNEGEYLFMTERDYEWQPLTCPLNEFTRSISDVRQTLNLSAALIAIIDRCQGWEGYGECEFGFKAIEDIAKKALPNKLAQQHNFR